MKIGYYCIGDTKIVVENEFVRPTVKWLNVRCDETALSNARIDVVPTQQILFFGFGVVFIHRV
jgi:hypothetical protein